MSDKAWGGRFSEQTDQLVERFTASIAFDKRLYPYDIAGSIAHCQMLAHVGIISEDEASQLIEGLGAIKREIEHGQFTFEDALEDIHMHIESRLFHMLGKVAHKLHTARSRNDQVALDVRMFLRDHTAVIIDKLVLMRSTLVDLADTHIDVTLPGYTHLQRAQPVLLSHHWMAYHEMFARDTQRFMDAYRRINVMPLGSAALAGTTYPIDPYYPAQLLDFPAITANSMDAVSDRDFVIEFLAAASLCMIHFSRLSEELILWSSSEFGFIEFSDAFSTGSSIMPQKKNPDVAELVRGKTGRVIGSLVNLLVLMKSLPLAYNRDMQDDKLPLFEAVDVLSACIEIYTRMLPTITINDAAMQQATTTGFLNATDMADYLVNRGMAFRDAHACAGAAVGFALNRQKELHELDIAELRSFSTLIGQDIFEFLTTRQMIDRRRSAGGTATANVLAAIQTARQQLRHDAMQGPALAGS